MSRMVSEKTIKTVSLRLMPVLFISYMLAYIDRINIGFAALKMNSDIGISPYIFGFGAGVFFLSYFIFEVPSNLALAKFGARRWISRIMISWGIISAAMAFVQGPASFFAVRFLFGGSGSRFLPGRYLIPDILVSGAVSGPDYRRIHCRRARLSGAGRSDFDSDSSYGRNCRLKGMAMAVYPSRPADCLVRLCIPDRDAGPAA
jgi:hypothetical protein